MLIKDKFKIPEIINIEEYKDNKELYDFNYFVETKKDKVFLYPKNDKSFFWNLMDISANIKEKAIYMIVESDEEYLYIYGANTEYDAYSRYNHFFYKIKIIPDTDKIDKKSLKKLININNLIFDNFDEEKTFIFFANDKDLNYLNDFIENLKKKNKNIKIKNNNFSTLFNKLLLIPIKEKFLYKISPLLFGALIFVGSYYYLKYRVQKENHIVKIKSNSKIENINRENENLEKEIQYLKQKINYLEKIKKNNIKVYGE